MKSEPHKIKTVKNLYITTQIERSIVLREAGLNTFNISSDKITYDMVSRGISAKSQEQESGSLIGDETYAGSRNFEDLERVVAETFGHKHTCPVHNLQGALKLITTTMITPGSKVLSNSSLLQFLVENEKGELIKLKLSNENIFTGDIDLEVFKNYLQSESNVSYIFIDLYADGYHPVSYSNLESIYKIADESNSTLILNISQIVGLAVLYQKEDEIFHNTQLKDIVYRVSQLVHAVVLDAAQDPRCNTGGLIATNDFKLYEKFMNEVVVYEGLHTYGGMAGRTMESFKRGIAEMVYEPQAEWIWSQVELLSNSLVNIPHIKGVDGVYILADKFLQPIEGNHAQALSSLLYLKAGIRCLVEGKYGGNNILPVQIPRFGLTNDQIKHIAMAINEIYKEREKLTRFELINNPEWEDEALFSWNNPILKKFEYECEAFRILTIEYVGETSRQERETIMKDVGFNTFLLSSSKVTIDLLTDSGTCAQTNIQWSHYNNADETPASSKDYFEMIDTLKEVTGYKYIIPTHQGRAAEHIMSQVLISGGYVPGNMYFTTTKLHQEKAGGTFIDVICDEAHDPSSTYPWKGNIDIKKIQKVLDEHGEGCIPYISFEFSVNLAGGQPVSMENVREVYEFCKSRGILVMFDATRAVENAYMIKKKDPYYANASIRNILRELFSYGDGCTVSSKKDYLVNIGGFLGIRDDESFYKKALSMLRIYEGTRTNGGMSSGDMAMHAEGVREMLDFNYIKARVEQTQYLGEKLLSNSIPVVQPIGSHAVFLDAKRFLPHIDQNNYPAQALAAALFIESGIRAMERGNVSSGRNKKTGENYCPALELVRLTIPRRAYTNAHMDLVADSIINLYKRRDQIKGLEFIYEPENLRFFQGKFEEIGVY